MTAVLVVDDSESTRSQIASQLDGLLDVAISFASNGAEAIRSVRLYRPDIVLCDLEMPIMSGVQFVRTVRATWTQFELPILVLTGRSATIDKTRAFSAGANDYLTKPIDADELRARVGVQVELCALQKAMLKAQAVMCEQRRLDGIGRLAAGIAHEINTPTQYIGDNLAFLRDGLSDLLKLARVCETASTTEASASADAELRQSIAMWLEEADLEFLVAQMPLSIEQCQAGTARIGEVVSAMKDFARPPSSQKECVDVNALIDTTLAVTRSAWHGVVTLETAFGAGLDRVNAFSAELRQALFNIIINAVQAVERSGKDARDGRVSIATRRIEDVVEISLRDNGTGIDEAIVDKIFDPFFTTHEVGDGMGQGLTVARAGIVDKHGGTLDVESHLGHGSTFTIRLPLEPKTN